MRHWIRFTRADTVSPCAFLQFVTAFIFVTLKPLFQTNTRMAKTWFLIFSGSCEEECDFQLKKDSYLVEIKINMHLFTCICSLCILHTSPFLQGYYQSLHIDHEDINSENQSDFCKASICYNPDSRYRIKRLIWILIPKKHLMQTWEDKMLQKVFSYWLLLTATRNLKLI